jgi:TM2 domain-containing membrane protein YozV
VTYPNVPEPYQPQQFSGPPYPAPYSPGPLSPAQSYAFGPAPYGVDPMTGVPLSDKSKIVAGLLQILPGFAMGLGGIGRLYAGQTTLGVIQIAATVVGWASFWCGFLLLVPFVIYFAVWLWFVVDGIVILAGRPTDGLGRPLRS